MRPIAALLLPALAAFSLAFTSCKSKKTELQDIQVGSSQLTSLVLTSTDAAAAQVLGRLHFTIRNGQEGRITNTTPLPYAQDLSKVRLAIAAADPVATVEVALGSGDFSPWTATKEYDLSTVRDLRIRVTTQLRGRAETYVYQLHLSSYINDPQTFQWSEATASGLPSFTNGLAQLEPRAEGASLLWVDPAGSNQRASYSASPTSWTSNSLSGIPSGETLTSAAQLGTQHYVTTSADKLYREQGGQWVEVPGTGIVRLLSTLSSTQGQPQLAVITSQGGVQHFARYDGQTVESRGYTVPTGFPTAGSYCYSATVQGALTNYLFGSHQQGDKVYPERWWTTNGLQWAVDRSSTVYTNTPSYETSIHLAATGETYRFVSTASGLDIYFSHDGGLNWEHGRSIALTGLTPSDFAGARLLALPSSDKAKIYLLRAGASPKLYEGQIRRSEHN